MSSIKLLSGFAKSLAGRSADSSSISEKSESNFIELVAFVTRGHFRIHYSCVVVIYGVRKEGGARLFVTNIGNIPRAATLKFTMR